MKLYSIGQVSSMIDIPVKTIRYYESIGLCTPSQTDENSNYRYYSIDDIFRLDLIRALGRQLGVPLKTIKEYFERSGDPDRLTEYLQQQEREIDAEIEELRQRKQFLSKKIRAISERKDRRLLVPTPVECGERVLSVRREVIHSVDEAMLLTRRVATLYDPDTEAPMYMIRDVTEEQFEDFDGIQVLVGIGGDQTEHGLSLYKLEAGKYLRIVYQNREEQRRKAMDLLRAFMREHGLTRTGPMINSGSVIDSSSPSSADYCLTTEFRVE
ncbi:MAG: MerR family transcriptional regulator [Oscillospiraceae bacterium]|nr:MerR family transcriptional regulator [Oscillospiraceae bacterium]